MHGIPKESFELILQLYFKLKPYLGYHDRDLIIARIASIFSDEEIKDLINLSHTEDLTDLVNALQPTKNDYYNLLYKYFNDRIIKVTYQHETEILLTAIQNAGISFGAFDGNYNRPLDPETFAAILWTQRRTINGFNTFMEDQEGYIEIDFDRKEIAIVRLPEVFYDNGYGHVPRIAFNMFTNGEISEEELIYIGEIYDNLLILRDSSAVREIQILMQEELHNEPSV